MANSLIVSVVVLSVVALASSKHVNFANCGGGAKIEYVDISPCETEPCEMKKGTNESVEVQFIPNTNITDANTVIHGIIEGLPVPFPVDDPDVCENHGITCPMPAGKPQTFKATLPVKSEYPALQLVVKWEMVGNKNETDVFCFEVPLKIVDGQYEKFIEV